MAGEGRGSTPRRGSRPGCGAAPTGATTGPRAAPADRTGAGCVDQDPPPALTYVFVLRPTDYARWAATKPHRRTRVLGSITSEVVVNERHGVNPAHSVLLEVTGAPAALRAVAAGLAVNGSERDHLAQRIASSAPRHHPPGPGDASMLAAGGPVA